jgi:hypothetical protein
LELSLRLAEARADPPINVAAFLSAVEQFSDDELNEYLAEFVGQMRSKSAPGSAP